MRSIRTLTALLILCLATDAAAQAKKPAKEPTPFDQGKVSVGLGVSATIGPNDKRYVVANASFGYFVVDGLEVGLGGAYWIGPPPAIGTVTPQVRYILPYLPVHPYVGVFYRHMFIGQDYDDVDTAGARAGLVVVTQNVLMGAGIVYERLIFSDCVDDCAFIYPEIQLSLSF